MPFHRVVWRKHPKYKCTKVVFFYLYVSKDYLFFFRNCQSAPCQGIYIYLESSVSPPKLNHTQLWSFILYEQQTKKHMGLNTKAHWLMSIFKPCNSYKCIREIRHKKATLMIDYSLKYIKFFLSNKYILYVSATTVKYVIINKPYELLYTLYRTEVAKTERVGVRV